MNRKIIMLPAIHAASGAIALMAVWLATGVDVTAQKHTRSGVRPQVVSLPDGPGAINGLGESFELSLNMGSGQYAFPIDVPPGRAGHAPDVRLVYNTGNGNGVMGIGWRLPIMCVKRQTDKGLPRYDAAGRPDRYITGDGAELVLVEIHEQDGRRVYRLKNEQSFTRYVYFAAEDRWECTNRSGVRYSLGARINGDDVAARIRHPEGRGTYSWHVAEAIDTNDNQILYSYRTDRNQAYCREIVYGAPEKNDPATVHVVTFEYGFDRPGDVRPDPVVDYRSTFRVVTAKRLEAVVVASGDDLVRKYRLTYSDDRSVSLLTGITLIGADDADALPPVAFGYTDNTPAGTAELTPVTGLAQATLLLSRIEQPHDNPRACVVIDFDGDGLHDFYQSCDVLSGAGSSDVVFRNLGEGRFEMVELTGRGADIPVQSESSFVMDVNGDGLADLLGQKGSNPEDLVYRLNTGGDWAATETPIQFPDGRTFEDSFRHPEARLVDLNFDKQVDIIQSIRVSTPDGSRTAFSAFLNNGDGTFEFIARTDDNGPAGLNTTFAASGGTLLLVDANGDRLNDLVLLRDATNGGPIVWPSMGYGVFDESRVLPLSDGPDFAGDPSRLADVELEDLNGDGLADLYMLSGSTIMFWLNEGGRRFGTQHTLALPKQIDPAVTTFRIMEADGDGLSDLMFHAREQVSPDFIPAGFSYVRLFRDNRDRLSDEADNDGDGRTDEADEGNSAPNLMCSVSNGIGKVTSVLYGSHIEDMCTDHQAGRSWDAVIPTPIQVIRRVETHDGRGAVYRTDYRYHDGYYDGVEKEFRGFGEVEQIDMGDDSIGDLVTVSEFDTGRTDEALKGRLLALSTQTIDGKTYYSDSYTWRIRHLRDGVDADPRSVRFPFQSSKVRTIRETRRVSRVQLRWDFEFDDFGNLIRKIEHGRLDRGWDDERVTTSTYSAAYPSGRDNWILDRLIERVVADENGVVATRQRHWYDDPEFSDTTPLGRITRGNLTMTRSWYDPDDADGYVTSVRNRYTPHGNLASTFDPIYDPAAPDQGHFRGFEYDDEFHTYPVAETIHTGAAAGPLRVSATVHTGFGVVTSSKDFNGFTTRYGYDDFGRLIRVIRPPNQTHTVEYDYILAHSQSDGRVLNWVETRQSDNSEDDGFLRTRRFYDGLGREIMTRAEGETPDQTVVSNVTTFNARQLPRRALLPYFDESASLDYREPDAAREFTETFYDALGRPIRVNQPADADGRVAHSETEYRPLSTLVRDEEQTNPDSPYFRCGRRFIEDGLQDGNGKGRLRRVIEIVRVNAMDAPTAERERWRTTYDYDLLDNLTGYRDSRGNRKTIACDGLSRPLFMNDPDRGYLCRAFDDLGNVIRTRDARGVEIAYAYDGANRLEAEYDITESEQLGSDLEPETRWRLPAESLPDREPDVAYHYDEPAGPVAIGDLWETDASELIEEAILTGAGLAPELDANNDGRVDVADAVAAQRTPGAGSVKLTAVNTRGLLAWVRDPSGEEHLSYDARGRVNWTTKRIRDLNTGALKNYHTRLTHDVMDRVNRVTYPDGTYIDFQYNTRGALDAVPGVVSQLDYAADGRVTRRDLDGGVTTTYTYDHRLRLQRLRSVRTADNLPLQDLSYTFDAVTNIIGIADNRGTPALEAIGAEIGLTPAVAHAFDATQSFTYDSSYRLASAGNPDVYGSIRYTFDRIGNMLSRHADLIRQDPLMDLGSMHYGGDDGAHDRNGRPAEADPGPHALTSAECRGGDRIVLQHDANGNVIAEETVNADGTTRRRLSMHWDHNNRLTTVSTDAADARYVYDATDTRRIRHVVDRSTSAVSQVHYIDRYSEVRDGRLIKYCYIGNDRIARDDSTAATRRAFAPSTYYLHDHIGSTSIAIAASGTCAEQLANYPFGHPRLDSGALLGTSSSDYRFTGKERDSETGLHYFEARYLSAHLGRFASVDPLLVGATAPATNPQALNLYAYANNHPLTYTDPSGELPIIPAILGALWVADKIVAAYDAYQDYKAVESGQKTIGDVGRDRAAEHVAGVFLGAIGRAGVKQYKRYRNSRRTASAYSGVWKLDPKIRGRKIEDLLTPEYEAKGWLRTDFFKNDATGEVFGADNFPLVDFHKGDSLLSLKTIDTTGSTWMTRTQSHIKDLGKREATISGKPANMLLDIRVQSGGLLDANSLIKFGREHGVKVNISEFP